MNKTDILRGAKEAFFQAMMLGYAKPRDNGENLSNPVTVAKDGFGYTTITVKVGYYTVVDRYCTSPHSNKSAGTTTIFFQNDPVWWMSYNGCYEDEAIPFLKKALLASYRRKTFAGGRGPAKFKSGDLAYRNRIKSSSFADSYGIEEIFRLGTRKCLGYHVYIGVSLI